MFKTVSLSIIFLVASLICSQAQVGTAFPAIPSKKLSGKSFPVPDSVKGKYTIIGIAFSKKAEDNLVTWYQPAFQTFIQKKKSVFENEQYDVNTYFVAVVTGANKVAADEALKAMRAQTLKELQPYVLTYVGEFASYKKTLGIQNADDPYFFVLDEKGVIVHVTSGAYTIDKMEAIEEIVSTEE